MTWKEKVIFYLNEEFKDMTKTKGGTVSIYRNPTSKEIKEIMDETEECGDRSTRIVRFVIDIFNKSLYVWSPVLLHAKAASLLKFPYDPLFKIVKDRYMYRMGAISKDFKIKSPEVKKGDFKKYKIEDLKKFFSL